MIVGVDPGLHGAISFLRDDGEFVSVADMPIMLRAVKSKKARVKNQVNPAALASIIRERCMDGTVKMPAKAYVERVSTRPGQGIASNGSLMHSLGVVEGVLGALGIPCELVHPQTWKRHFNIGPEKEQARAAAQRLYPEAPLERKLDSGRAEAILIARFGQALESF